MTCAQHCIQAVGDAISDAMFVEAVLTIKGWTIEQWAAMYTDLPRQVVFPGCAHVPMCPYTRVLCIASEGS